MIEHIEWALRSPPALPEQPLALRARTPAVHADRGTVSVQKCNPKDLMYQLVPFLEKNSSLFMKVCTPQPVHSVLPLAASVAC